MSRSYHTWSGVRWKDLFPMRNETVGMFGILAHSTASSLVGFGRLSHNLLTYSITLAFVLFCISSVRIHATVSSQAVHIRSSVSFSFFGSTTISILLSLYMSLISTRKINLIINILLYIFKPIVLLIACIPHLLISSIDGT